MTLIMLANMFDLTGRNAVVTGSTKGIGKAIAVALAQHGARVVISSRDEKRVNSTVDELRSNDLEVIGIPCNVSRKNELQSLVSETNERWGNIDILVGNAAINPHYGSALEVPDEIFSKILASNIQSNLWLAQLVAPGMRNKQDGAIIFVSSIGGFFGSEVIGTYCISKAGDFQLARNLAVELGPDNIRVNCIAPGLVKTDFARKLWEDPESSNARIQRTPLGRLGEPDDVAGIAVYLASDAGRWTTGQTIVVDGGVSISK